MAKPMRLFNPQLQFLDNSGLVVSGGKLFIYLPGTTTKLTTYTDSTLGTANPNPIILDSAGRPSNGAAPIDIFITQACKVVLAPSTDMDPPTNPYWTRDNVTTLGQLVATTAKSANYTVQSSDRDFLFKVDATLGTTTITLLPAATAGDGFQLNFKKIDSTSNTVIIQANGAETIDGVNTLILSSQYQQAAITCDGTAWYITSNTSTSVGLPTVITKTTNYTVGTPDRAAFIKADATSGALSIFLPSAVTVGNGFSVSVKKVDASANIVTVQANGSQTIDGLNTKQLVLTNDEITIISDSSNWWVVNSISQTSVLAESSAYSVLTSDRNKIITVDATSLAVTVSLLSAVTAGSGFQVTIKKIDNSVNNVTIQPAGSEIIDGRTSIILAARYQTIKLISNGVSWYILDKTISINTQTITTTGSGTYIPSIGMQYCIIELQGAGGGSGGATGSGSNSAASGGGGGGAYIKLIATSAQIGTSAAGSVGAGGVAGTAGANPGGTGGSTTLTISGSTWTAGGGIGGSGSNASTIFQVALFGGGGGATIGTNATSMLAVSGSAGGFGCSSGSSSSGLSASCGGSSILGNSVGGGAGGATAAQPGLLYGGGAAGAANGSTGNVTGAAGAQGCIIITEFIF